MTLIERCAIVTGAGSGIGRSVALRLAGQGWKLALIGRRIDALRGTSDHCAGEPLLIASDLAQPQQPQAVVEQTLQRFGSIDALVNNAGHAELQTISQTSFELFERTFAVNVYGSALLIARAFPALQAAPDGVIVQVTSMATADPFPGFFAYAAAKSAAESFVRSVRSEGGVRAYAVAPGATETPMLRALFSTEVLPRDAAAEPDSVAAVIDDCIHGRRSEPSGSTILLAGS